MDNLFIVLRGPSGSGKSTIADAIKERAKLGTIIIGQDYFNHVLFKNMHDDHGLIPRLIGDMAKSALHAGYNVILEGIFRKEKYERMIHEISTSFSGSTFVYYFDISPEETKRRHAMRNKSRLFGEAEMLEWYDLAGPLCSMGETILDEGLSEDDIVLQIILQTGMATKS